MSNRYYIKNSLGIKQPIKLHIKQGGNLYQFYPPLETNIPVDPNPNPSPATGIGLQYSDQEKAVWRVRAGLDVGSTMYKTFEDVQTNSPGDWDRVKAEADKCVNNSSNDRFLNYYKGDGEIPNFPPTEVYKYEPKDGGFDLSAHSVSCAALWYYISEDESYAKPVRDELVWYANNPYLDCSDRTRWVYMQDGNPGFITIEWFNRMLIAYDFCKGSSHFTQNDIQNIESWLKKASDWAYDNATTHTANILPGRLSDNYYTSSHDRDDVRGYYHEGGDPVYTISVRMSNRIIHYYKFLMYAGLKFSNENHINVAKRFFKELIAFGTHKNDCIYGDLYRSSSSQPERGFGYYAGVVHNMGQIADVYARFRSTELFDYELDQEDYNMFYGPNLSRIWMPTLAATGKSFYKFVDSFLKYFDGTYGNSRQWGGDIIDGKTDSPLQDNTYDTYVAFINTYYRNENWREIYTRNKSGQRPYSQPPLNNIGSFKGWDGMFYSNIALLGRYGKAEGLFFPYIIS